MLLWIILATLTTVVLLVLLRPLLRGKKSVAGRGAFDAAVYRDQLREVETDRERGLIGEKEAEAARLEISRRLLASAQSDASEQVPPSRGSNAVMLSVAAMLPLIAIGLYLAYGSPGLPDQPLAARLEDPSTEQDLAAIVARVEARLREHPEEGEGWDAIAPVYLGIGRYGNAAEAFDQALKLLGESPKRLAGRGQALVLANDGVVSEEARRVLERALVLDPTVLEPRILLAIAKEQDGKFAAAIEDWRGLLAAGDESASWRQMVEKRIAAAEAHLADGSTGGGAPKTTVPSIGAGPKSGAGPTAGDVAAAQAMSPSDRQAMVEQMVQRLAERLEQQGDDLSGWLKLVKAYTVLDRKDDAQKALARAKSQFSGDGQALQQLDALAAELGLKS